VILLFEICDWNLFIALQSPRYPNSVFIFGPMINGVLEPTGTCFAVSDRYLLTAQHNMEGRKLANYGIALTLSKTDGVQDPPVDFHEVKVKYYNVQADWAILELIGPTFSPPTVPIPITVTINVEQDTDFKVFHMPISDYIFQDTDDISAGTARGKTAVPTRHHIRGNMGLFSGSSGAPFVLRNGYCFAMHVEGRNAVVAVPIGYKDDAEVVSETVNSNVHTHASRCSGLYFQKCRRLV
jgi:hypothetical protein